MNWEDYGARMLDILKTGFGTMDPMAEKYYSISPYAYCLSNPISNTDPTGMWVITENGIKTSNQDEIAAYLNAHKSDGNGSSNGENQDGMGTKNNFHDNLKNALISYGFDKRKGISLDAALMIAKYEGITYEYSEKSGTWGIGHAPIEPLKDHYTFDEIVKQFISDIGKHEGNVYRYIKGSKITQGELDGFVSLDFNTCSSRFIIIDAVTKEKNPVKAYELCIAWVYKPNKNITDHSIQNWLDRRTDEGHFILGSSMLNAAQVTAKKIHWYTPAWKY